MKIKEAENDIQKNVEELRKIRDEITKLHDEVADSDIEGKEILTNSLRCAGDSVVSAIMSLERAEIDHKEFVDSKEEREAMGRFHSFRPW